VTLRHLISYAGDSGHRGPGAEQHPAQHHGPDLPGAGHAAWRAEEQFHRRADSRSAARQRAIRVRGRCGLHPALALALALVVTYTVWCVQVPGAAGRADLQEHLDLLRGLLHVSPARLFANTCLTSSPTANPPTQEGRAARAVAGGRGPARGPALPALRAGPAAEVRLLPQLAAARAVEAGSGLAEDGQRRTERSVIVQLRRCVGTGRWRFRYVCFGGLVVLCVAWKTVLTEPESSILFLSYLWLRVL
jgi:hypothetical protein